MKFYALTLVFASSMAHCQFSDFTPTQQLLPMIAQSRTLWKANFLWKERLKQTTHEETSLVETDSGKILRGGLVKAMPLITDGVKAYFTINYNLQKDTVTVVTNSEMVKTQAATEVDQSSLVAQKSKPVVSQQIWQEDDYTRCNGTSTLIYHPEDRKFAQRATSVCRTVMPFHIFMAAMMQHHPQTTSHS